LVLNEAAGRGLMTGDQRHHFTAQLVIMIAFALDKSGSPAFGKRDGFVEKFSNGLPAFRVHDSRASSRCSQASAILCSRPTVATETFSAWAVSSTLNPPK